MSTKFWYITVRGTPKVSVSAGTFFLLKIVQFEKAQKAQYLISI